MTTSRSNTKCLKVPVKQFLYMVAQILHLAHEISSFLERSYIKRFSEKPLKIPRKIQKAVIRRCSLKNVFLKFAKFAGKHMRWILYLIKLTAKPVTLLERYSSTGFSAFCKFYIILQKNLMLFLFLFCRSTRFAV